MSLSHLSGFGDPFFDSDYVNSHKLVPMAKLLTSLFLHIIISPLMFDVIYYDKAEGVARGIYHV